MYYGEVSNELSELYETYYEKFGVDPDFYEEVEYKEDDYNKYVKDIKKAIKLNKELPDIN